MESNNNYHPLTLNIIDSNKEIYLHDEHNTKDNIFNDDLNDYLGSYFGGNNDMKANKYLYDNYKNVLPSNYPNPIDL